jgi:hypothetical protein
MGLTCSRDRYTVAPFFSLDNQISFVVFEVLTYPVSASGFGGVT